MKSLKREIDVVKSLPPHENIVELFGVEEEVSCLFQLQGHICTTFSTMTSLGDKVRNKAYNLSNSENRI